MRHLGGKGSKFRLKVWVFKRAKENERERGINRRNVIYKKKRGHLLDNQFHNNVQTKYMHQRKKKRQHYLYRDHVNYTEKSTNEQTEKENWTLNELNDTRDLQN
jgi:hypothetical protein